MFIFDRKVDDFHAVDYEAIAMLNVSAIQELNQQLKVLQSDLSDSRAENELLQAKLEKLESLEQRLAQIEATLRPSNTAAATSACSEK